MGYSIMTVFNKLEHKKMLEFLNNNFLDWDQLSTLENYVRGPTDDVSYGPETGLVIGFDYGGACQETDIAYAYRICYWMARITGKKTVLYDGDEEWNLDDLGVDEIGFRRLKKFEVWFSPLKRRKYDKIVKNELKRLTQKWSHEFEQR
jgi:hypothetical protein